MKHLVLCIFALVASSVEETVETYPQGSWIVSSDSTTSNDLPKVQLTSSTGTSTSSATAETDSPQLTQHYNIPTKLHAIDGNAAHSPEYLPTIVKHVPFFINEKQSSLAYGHPTHSLYSPEMYSYQNAQPFFLPAAQIPQINTMSQSFQMNQMPHLAQIAQIPQGQSPFARLVHVPHVPQMLSIPQYSQFGVPSIAHAAHMSPFEHMPSIVKPYPVYIKEPQQSVHFDDESNPNLESNYWPSESFNPYHGFPKPSKFHYQNNPGINDIRERFIRNPYEPVHSVLKPVPFYVGDKHYPNPNNYGVSRSGSGSWTSEGGYHEQNPNGFAKHKNLLIKRKQLFV